MKRNIIYILLILTACNSSHSDSHSDDPCPKIDQIDINREDYIPSTADKVTPAEDIYPPVLHLTADYYDPEPLDSVINTAGAEDSAYFDPGTDTLYFWFTPDISVSAEEQISDPSTGIFRAARSGSSWEAPVKVWLFDVVSLTGCACAQGNRIWYCAAVCGSAGLKLYFSDYSGGSWTNGELDEVLNNPDYGMGEFHITADGNTIYYHSDVLAGKGGRDLWKIEKTGGLWGDPVNLDTLNTEGSEGFPFLTADGSGLWFSGDSRTDLAPPLGTVDYFGAVFRSTKSGGSWQAPVEVVSQLAGEPAVDTDGNVYFTHHFYRDNKPVEADIYVIRKK